MIPKYFTFLLFFVVVVQNVYSACNAKKYKTGTVCVCNVNACDTIPALDLTPGQAAVYTTSTHGDRLERQIVYPTDNNPFGTIHMTIDSSKKYQTIQGFGGTFTDAAGANLRSLPDKLADQIIKEYFSPDGMSYTFARVPMASSDFSTRVYSYNDVKGDYEMQSFNLTQEDFQYKIPYIKSAQAYSNNNLKLFASPWSAPGWMKTSGEMAGPGSLQGKAGDQYHKAYAKYFVRFLQEYQNQGINFWGLTPQNEPTTGNEKKYKTQTMYFSAETQRDFIKEDLGPALHDSDAGKDVKLIILDDNRNNLPGWADTVLKDKQAAAYVSGIGVHFYDDSASTSHLDETNKKHGSYFLLATEAEEGAGTKNAGPVFGSWDRAEDYASDILEDLNHYVTGWVDKNLALDIEGGPSWAEQFADAPVIVFASTAEYVKQPTWYAIAHFSRFIQPGAVRIDDSFDVIELNVKRAAFLNPDGSKVVVVLNTGGITHHTVVVHDSQDATNHYQFSVGTHSLVTIFIKATF